MNSPSRTILVIDDSAEDRELYRHYLLRDRNYCYTVLEAESGQQGLDLWQQSQPDAILLNDRLPDGDVLELLAQVQRFFPQKISPPVVVVTGQGNEAIAVDALKAGAQDYLIKGQISLERLQFSVNNAIETAQLRNQQQQQQKEYEQQFRAIFDTTFQFVGLVKPDGTLLEANQTALDFGGLQLSDVMGRPFWETRWWTISPEIQTQLQQAIATAAGGEFVRYEVEVLGAGARVITLDFSIKPIFDDRKQVVLLITEGRNISDRKQLEAEIQRLNQELARRVNELQIILNTAPVGIAIAEDPACQVIRANGFAQSMLMVPPEANVSASSEQAVSRPFRETRNGEDIPPEELPMQLATAQGRAVKDAEIQMVRADGAVFDWWVNAVPLFDEQGEVRGCVAAFMDITENKRIEANLRESEARLQLALHGANQGIWDWDLKTEVLTWDDRCKAIFGLPPNFPVTYQWHLDAIHPEDRQRVFDAAAIALHERNEFDEEYRAFWPDGTTRWILARGRGYYNKAGEPYRMSGTVMDITERKQAQLNDQFLNNLDLRLRQLTDVQAMEWEVVRNLGEYLKVDRCLWHEIDWDNGLTTVERTWRSEDIPDINGIYTLEDYFTPQQLSHFAAGQTMIVNDVTTHPETAPYAQNYLPLAAGAFISVPCIYSGQWVAVLAVNAKTARSWREDEVVLLQETVARLWSIIEQTRAIQELRDSEERFQKFMNNSPFAAFIKDETGHLRYANRLVEQLFQKSVGELVGCNDFEILPEVLAQEIQEHDRRVFETGEAMEFVETIPSETGELTYWLTIKFLLGEHRQALLGGIAVDISDRVQFERDRERILQQEQVAREEAERANRVKDEFLAVLSHELRSPLNPILGWTKLMQSRQFSPTETAAALATIERSVKVQIQLIDDLLDVAKILRGKLNMNVEAVNLIGVMQAAIETVSTAALAKSIELHPVFSFPDGQVRGDFARLQQIVWNLLSNAVKFTPEQGRVEIRLDQVDHQARITVSDTGKGINPDFLPHIFESFRQEDASTTRKFGGLGLGLAIVRSLVEAHGGTIWADSPGEGQGATFTVQLPLLPAPSDPLPTHEPIIESDLDLTGLRVLTVDDDPEVRELLMAILRQFGADVLSVASAIEALSVLETFQPDVLVSDVGMPDMDGYGLIQQVRTHSFYREKPLPAIALTAYAREEDQQRVLSEGFQQHLAKPIEPLDLVQAIARCVRGVGVG